MAWALGRGPKEWNCVYKQPKSAFFASWLCSACSGVDLGTPIQEKTLGQTKDMLERWYHSTVLGASWCHPGGFGGSCWGEERLDYPAQTVPPMTQTWLSGRNEEMNEKMNFSEKTAKCCYPYLTKYHLGTWFHHWYVSTNAILAAFFSAQ